MTQEDVLIPKMKRLNNEKRKINIPVLNIILPLFCVLLIIGSTFLNLNIKHYIIPSGIFSEVLTHSDFIYEFNIIPQIPVLMLICSALGKKMATSTVILYILCGLFFMPVFALGGGISYFAQYSFGYILSFVPAIIVAGSFLQRKYSFLYMLFATLSAVLIIHVGGIIYFLIIALLKHDNGAFISTWIKSQSGIKIIYDIVFSYVMVLAGKYINLFLKFVLK